MISRKKKGAEDKAPPVFVAPPKPKTAGEIFLSSGPPRLQPGMPPRAYAGAEDYARPGPVKTFMVWAWDTIVKDGPISAADLYARSLQREAREQHLFVTSIIAAHAPGYGGSKESAADAILMAVAQAGWLVPVGGGPIRPGAVYTATGTEGYEWFDPWRDPPK